MAELPHPDWIPYFPADYRRDKQHLTTLQHGIYHLLIDYYIENGGLPDDDRRLAGIALLSLPAWRKERRVIEPLFHGDGPWRHKRIDADLAKAASRIEAKRRAGSKGGTVSAMRRWQADAQANGTPSAQANAQQSKSKNNITSTSSVAAREGLATGPSVRPPDPTPTIEPGDSLAVINRKLGWVP